MSRDLGRIDLWLCLFFVKLAGVSDFFSGFYSNHLRLLILHIVNQILFPNLLTATGVTAATPAPWKLLNTEHHLRIYIPERAKDIPFIRFLLTFTTYAYLNFMSTTAGEKTNSSSHL